jgi:hypothetical protein
MNDREVMGQKTIAISISESPDMPALGLTDAHLRDAMAEIARHLLAFGVRLAYGGDLRNDGFADLLFELVARQRRDAAVGDERNSVSDYLAWPVHIEKTAKDLEDYASQLSGSAGLVLLTLDGGRYTLRERQIEPSNTPTDAEWSQGLTAMRKRMLDETDARIVLGGRVEGYKGIMPGIAEESLLSLKKRQPLFLMGGYGGCAKDIAETLGFQLPMKQSQSRWDGREAFEAFNFADLKNGLNTEENSILVNTPHVDQANALILRGLMRLNDPEQTPIS